MKGANYTAHLRYTFLKCPLDPLSRVEILAGVNRTISSGGRLRIEGLNVAKLVQARRDSRLMHALEDTDIVHLDGVGVAWAGRMLGYQLPPRRAGCDLMLDLLLQAALCKHRVYFLGATEEVIASMMAQLVQRFPNLHVAGARDGYFRPDQEAAVAEDIRRSCADLLFVGISSPKKELFVSRWWERLAVPVVVGVGGSFDVLSGRLRRSPRPIQRIGLEWLFRLCQEPRRLAYRYLSTNTIFAALLLRELLHLEPVDIRQGYTRSRLRLL